MDGRPYDLRSDRLADQVGGPSGPGGSPPPYEQRELTVGNVVGEALELYRRFFVRFFSIAFVVFLATNLLTALAGVPANDVASGVIAVLAGIAGIVGFFFVQGALTLATDDVRDGSVDTGMRELVRASRERLPALAGTSLLIGIVLGVGGAIVVIATSALGAIWLGVLLVLPVFLFLLARWSLVTPIVMLERGSGFGAIQRSSSLVKGHGGSVFWIIVVTGVLAGVATAVIRALIQAVLSGFLAVWLTSTIANAVTTPFVALAWTLMYFHLRRPEPTLLPRTVPAGAAYTEN
jgi:hypothetical protein